MEDIQTLLNTRIDAFQARFGLSDWKIGVLALRNEHAVRRVRRGIGTLATVKALENFFDLHEQDQSPRC